MRVSVVMPAYNAVRTIGEAVRSVTEQTVTDWELLVIDDCSTDGTAEIAERLASEDARIRVLRNERNRGAAESRNRGVREARGEWIAFLDSDDLWREDKLEKQLRLTAERPDAALTYTASAFMDENGKRYAYVLPAQPEVTYGELLHRNLLTCSSVMAKRTLLLKHPFPDGTLHEDYAVWLQMLREIPCACGVDEPLLVYRLSRRSRSGARVRSAKMIYQSYRYVGYGAAASAWLTLRYLPYSVGKRMRLRRAGPDENGDG